MLDYILPFNVEADACNWAVVRTMVSDHGIVAQRLKLRHATDFQKKLYVNDLKAATINIRRLKLGILGHNNNLFTDQYIDTLGFDLAKDSGSEDDLDQRLQHEVLMVASQEL